MKRIQQHTEFDAALKNRAKNEGWAAAHTVDNQRGYARLGMVVGKRVMVRAVDRNRAKRLIREVFRNEVKQLGSQDVVVRVRMNPFILKSGPPRFAIVRLFKAIQKH